MTPVLSTYKILRNKALNHDIDSSWKEWAVEMMEAGYESMGLYELAGILEPYNQFELQELTSKILTEFNLDYSDTNKAAKDYIYYLVLKNIENPYEYRYILSEFTDLYYELDMASELQDFALLNWAKQDLMYEEIQWYWAGADRSNIDSIIKKELQKWKRGYELNNGLADGA
jgi:hypothetical protein